MLHWQQKGRVPDFSPGWPVYSCKSKRRKKLVKIWVNFWRYEKSLPPYDAILHISKEDAINDIAWKIKEDQIDGYLYTLELDPETLGLPTVLDLREAAYETVEEWRAEQEANEIEGRMLRWRQAGI